jgi:hypothetical protein
MADIDVGNSGHEADTTSFDDYTWFTTNNPANASGNIDHIQFYLGANASNDQIKVGVFYSAGGGNYTCRNVVTLTGITGSDTDLMEFDAPGDFTAFGVESGDYVGIYRDAGDIEIERNAVGDGGYAYWYSTSTGDYTGGTTAYTEFDGGDLSIYAEGTLVGGVTLEVGVKECE